MINVGLDISPFLNVVTEMDAAAKKAMQEAGSRLVIMTRAHIIEEANKKLHTRREMFVDGVTHMQLNDDTWVINLDSKVRWIDDGMEPHSMLDDLLKSPKAKRAKDGSAYVVVPFKHNKGPTQTTPAQKTLLDTLKKELKDRKIPYGKIETNIDGKPKLGLLHSFDIRNAPLKTANAPGQGKGPIGKVMQGPTGIPLLQGVRIYQHQKKSGGTQRDIMTFRVASSKHRGQGRWEHPGTEPVHIFDEAADWARATWEKEIVPQLMAQLQNAL